MSTGFRLFLLTLLSFLLVWVSRQRREDLAFWLGASGDLRAELERQGEEASPVEGVLPPIVRLEAQSPEIEPAPPPIERPRIGWGAAYAEDVGGPRDDLAFGAPDDHHVWSDPGVGGVWEWPEAPHDSGVYDDPPPFEEGSPPGAEERVEPSSEAPAEASPTEDGPAAGSVEAEAEPPGETEAEGGAHRTYTVVEGDNLSKIARKLLGHESRYPEIHELNRELLGPSTMILPGMELRIPAR